MKNVKPLQLAILAILDKADQYQWSVQGFGMLRLYIRDIGRLHIWDDALRYPGVSMIHNHSWDLRSTIVCGEVVNHIYTREELCGFAYKTHRMITGYDCVTVTPEVDCRLLPEKAWSYGAGDVYKQTAHVIHETQAQNGTVTLMERHEDANGEADIFWPVGFEWGTARPKAATSEEVERTVARALQVLTASL